MYRERRVAGSMPELGLVSDRKQWINDVLDKQLERSSLSTSQIVFVAKPPPNKIDSLASNNFSDSLYPHLSLFLSQISNKSTKDLVTRQLNCLNVY